MKEKSFSTEKQNVPTNSSKPNYIVSSEHVQYFQSGNIVDVVDVDDDIVDDDEICLVRTSDDDDNEIIL